jgi:hypothetical protein
MVLTSYPNGKCKALFHLEGISPHLHQINFSFDFYTIAASVFIFLNIQPQILGMRVRGIT